MTLRATNFDTSACSPELSDSKRAGRDQASGLNGKYKLHKPEDYENMTPFEQIREGMLQIIAHHRGEISLRSTTLWLPDPAPKFGRSRVAAIRRKTGMSQSVFAALLNVPKRTLESWEQGRRTPKAGEARLLQLVDADPTAFQDMVQRAERTSPAPRSRRKAG